MVRSTNVLAFFLLLLQTSLNHVFALPGAYLEPGERGVRDHYVARVTPKFVPLPDRYRPRAVSSTQSNNLSIFTTTTNSLPASTPTVPFSNVTTTVIGGGGGSTTSSVVGGGGGGGGGGLHHWWKRPHEHSKPSLLNSFLFLELFWLLELLGIFIGIHNNLLVGLHRVQSWSP